MLSQRYAAREELIMELEDMVYDHLMRFKLSAKIKPERLIFFRDGISEGEPSLLLSVYAGND